MTQVDLSSYKNLFVKSSNEYLDKLKADLEILSSNPVDKDAINNVYISIHSLGSQNLTMGYTSTGTLCRLMENFFYKVKNGQETLDSQKIQFVADAVLKVDESVRNIDANNSEIDLSLEQRTIRERLKL